MMDIPAPTYKVLVVDDSPVYRKLVEHVLEDGPYVTVFAKSVKEAIKLYAEHVPSIVITDWMMPDLSGLDLCKHIRAEDQHPYTYVIMLTSINKKENVVEGLAAGADDYLTKPFDPAELRARLGVGRRIIDLNREIAAQNRALEEAAGTDSLTGLSNRRAIEEWARRQLRGAGRHGFPVWVVICDIDTFKNINDTFGHAAGDAVLKAFAKLLQQNTRASDICGRLGGDEFMVVMTHVDQEGIRTVLDRFRQDFAALSFPFAGKSISATTSIGAAGYEGTDPPDLSELMSRADHALYASKRAGRNHVHVEVL